MQQEFFVNMIHIFKNSEPNNFVIFFYPKV